MDFSGSTVLGKNTGYPQVYDAALLLPVDRQPNRNKLGLSESLPFHGTDTWNVWELSWLNLKGKPQVAIGTLEISCDSQNIIESKSLKLYLNSLNQTRFSGEPELISLISRDLSIAAGSNVKFSITNIDRWSTEASHWQHAHCLDALDITCSTYLPDPSLLCLSHNQTVVTEKLCSHLLKTNCPVTGQPDWATIYIQYTGRAIDHQGLLAYIVSMRQHQGFHEHCVESVFVAISDRCQPEKLAVYARYTRRGGLDINPFRSNFDLSPGNFKLPRQ